MSSITTHEGNPPLIRPLVYLTAALSLVADEPVVNELRGTQGVHDLDLVVFGVELGLMAPLIAVLWQGFTRRGQEVEREVIGR